MPVCEAELRWAAAHELAITPEDLSDRRTRAGLVPEWREVVLAAARATIPAWSSALSPPPTSTTSTTSTTSGESTESPESSIAAGGEADASCEPQAAAAATSQSAPWRRLVRRAPAATAPARPSLVIDDADPESAERVREERAERADPVPRRSFLPPILLDRDDRSARQGGLTLAVILLLIAATLTLSYLMRRPSASGDGMTGREVPALRAERG